jgi:endoglucanase
MPIPQDRAATYIDWLKQISVIPTAAGKEGRVVAWIERWVGEREDLTLTRDEHHNLTIALRDPPTTDAGPLYLTAHLDHPGFVVEAREGERLTLAFRGGVMDDYFPEARVIIHTDRGCTHRATITARADGAQEPFKRFDAVLDDAQADVAPGDLGVWELPEMEVLPAPDGGEPVEGGVIFTNACDDLSAVAAALGTMEEVRLARARGERVADLRVLFTLAEEIGFVGAIGACRSESAPTNARLICLENSRADPKDSPIGAGPIVRVGDRVSVFSPELTAQVAKVAESLGSSAHPRATEKASDAPAFRWQRKLMAGGACEASVFCAFGYNATCVCLPLGNYHNMADLTAVQGGTNTKRARVGREHVALRDYLGMIELLRACATSLGESPSFRARLDKLWDERKFVLA